MTAAILTAQINIPSPAADSPDADLIRLCTEYVALSCERNRVLKVSSDDEFQAIVERLAEMEPAIAALPAQTSEGIQAKAAFVLHQTAADGSLAEASSEEHGPAHSLALDLLRGTVMSPTSAAQATDERSLPALANRLRTICLEMERLDQAMDINNPAWRDLMKEEAALERQILDMPPLSLQDVATIVQVMSHELSILDDSDVPKAESDELITRLTKATAAVLFGLRNAGVPIVGNYTDDETVDGEFSRHFGAVALEAARVAPATDDAEILHACAEIIRLDKAYCVECLEENANRPGHEERAEAHSNAQVPFVNLVGATRAKTMAGIRAKAAALAQWAPDLLREGAGDTIDVLTHSILRDLVGDDDSAPVVDPDAAVKAAAAEVSQLYDKIDACPGDAEEAFEDICERAHNAIRSLGAMPVDTLSGLRIKAAMLLEVQKRDRVVSGFNHSTAEQGALLMLEQLAGFEIE